MFGKKGQGMSLNVVIIAVIALIVLVVLVLIFTGKLKLFTKTGTDTTAQYTGQKCAVPGTNNECMSQEDCERAGGSWSAPPEEGYDDYCYSGCCSM